MYCIFYIYIHALHLITFDYMSYMILHTLTYTLLHDSHTITSNYMSYMQLYVIICKYMHYMVLHGITCFTSNYMCCIPLFVITCQCMHYNDYLHLHKITCVTICFMTLHVHCHAQEETTSILTLQWLHHLQMWITHPSQHNPLLAHRTHLANWQIQVQVVFCTTCWSRGVLQSSSRLACRVPCRSISRPWEAFPNLWGEQATEVPMSHRSARGIQVRVDSACWNLEPGLRQLSSSQLRANLLAAAAGGRATKCAVAGLVWVYNASFGGKNLPCNVCTAYTVRKRPVNHV